MNETEARLAGLYALHFDCISPTELTPVAASGGNREYYRLEGAAGSVIGTSGSDLAENRAFIYLSKHFAGKGLPVPHVLAVSDCGRYYLQTDCGCSSLFDVLADARTSGRFGNEDVHLLRAALGLYNSRIVKLINKKGMLKSSVIIDELPTIYFKGLDNLIATARSNKVAVCLGFQDFSQLVRDYGDKEAKVVMNTVGNIFSGQVVGETAKTLSERFGKVLQKRQSISINRQDVSTSINTQMDALIPPSKISGLTQGMFVGSVSDNFNERIEQKIFHCEIVVDAEKVKREERAYKKIPVITDFTDEDGNDRMKETVQANYRRIKEEVKQIVQEELERIKNDPVLCKLLPDNETV